MLIWGGKGGTDTGRYYNIFLISKKKINKKHFYCRDE